MPQGEFDGLGLGPKAVPVHDCLEVGVLDLDVRTHSAHTPTLHLTCKIRVPVSLPSRLGRAGNALADRSANRGIRMRLASSSETEFQWPGGVIPGGLEPWLTPRSRGTTAPATNPPPRF